MPMRRLMILLPLMAVAAPVAAAGFNLPPRKPGQWEMKIQVDTAAMPPQIIRMCLDAETDKMLNDRFGGLAANMCTKQEQRTEGDSIILDSECALGQMQSSTHTVVTGDFNTGPDSESHKTLTATLKDAWDTAPKCEGPAETFHNFTGNATKRIDWILYRGVTPTSVQTVTTSKDGRYPSDHFPVEAAVEHGKK